MDIVTTFYNLFPVKEKLTNFISRIDTDEQKKAEFEKKIIELILMKFLEAIDKSMDESDKELLENLVSEMQAKNDQNAGMMQLQSIFQQPKFRSVYDKFVAEEVDKILMELEAQS